MKPLKRSLFSLFVVFLVFFVFCCQGGSNHNNSTSLAASFTYSPASPVAGQAVQFTDTSTGSPTSWQWNFDGGSTSTVRNPSHTVAAVGSYTVSLSVSNNSGSDNTSHTVNVLPASILFPSDRKIDWSNAGVWVGGVKGIPSYSVGVTCAPPAYNVYPNETADSRAGIQAAIDACPGGRAVYLPAGTYRIGGRINLKSGVSLRGAGPGATTILATSAAACFAADSYDSSWSVLIDPNAGPDADNTSGPITSGYTKGSYTVVVSSALAASLCAGQIVLINQRNDPSFVTNQGTGGACVWAAGRGLRGLGETKIIASKSGTSITFTKSLYHNYQSQFLPKLIRMSSSPITNAGVENLTFDGGVNANACVVFIAVAHCWVKTVEFKNWEGFGVQITWGAVGCEVTTCYFHDPTAFGGSQGYSVSIVGNATDNYVYDNIAKWVKIMTAVGSTGGTANVVAYNYCHSTNHWAPHWAMPAYATHGIHTLMNLFEGNYGGRILFDGYWGSGSHSMSFRNCLTGNVNNPSVTANNICAEVEARNYYTSFVGNVFGYSGMIGDFEPSPWYEKNRVVRIWKVGFAGSADGHPADATTVSSLLRHGNYDYITKSTVWDGSIAERNIPPSLYLNSKPSWFGSLDWPAIGPDVTGYTKNTPSKLRWDTYVSSDVLSDLFSR